MANIPIRIAEDSEIKYLGAGGTGTQEDPFTPTQSFASGDGNPVDVQHPLPTDGDSVYAKDIETTSSSAPGWLNEAGEPGNIIDLFNNVNTKLYNDDVSNPKQLFVFFNRPLITDIVGLATLDATRQISNVKITSIQPGSVFKILYDNSADTTKHFQIEAKLDEPAILTGLLIEFFTADPVSLTYVGIAKTMQTQARLGAFSDIGGGVELIQSHSKALLVRDTAEREGVEEAFWQEIVSTTLNGAVAQNDTSIVVNDATGFAVGQKLIIDDLADDSFEAPFFTITNISGTTITLNRPTSEDYQDGSDVRAVTANLAVNGSLASPQIFEIAVPNTEVWELSRLMIGMSHPSSGDLGTFGDLVGLTNGLIIRHIYGNGKIDLFCDWKTNLDIKQTMYDYEPTSKAPGGSNGWTGRWTFERSNYKPLLDGTIGGKLQLLVQDNLSTLLQFGIKIQASIYKRTV